MNDLEFKIYVIKGFCNKDTAIGHWFFGSSWLTARYFQNFITAFQFSLSKSTSIIINRKYKSMEESPELKTSRKMYKIV